MRIRNPYRRGDQITVLHTCKHHGIALAVLDVGECKRLGEHSTRWRVRATRCDGSPLELEVGQDGRDDEGLAAPGEQQPERGGRRRVEARGAHRAAGRVRPARGVVNAVLDDKLAAALHPLPNLADTVPCQWPSGCALPATRAGRTRCATPHPWITVCGAHAGRVERSLVEAGPVACAIDHLPLPTPAIEWRRL